MEILDATREKSRSGFWLAIASLAASTTFVVTLYLVFDPRWQTIDDVWYSMITHGYGIAAAGSPNLNPSNVVWGYFVRALPTVNGILGYSLASIGVLVAVGAIILFSLYRLGAGLWLTVALFVLLMISPVLSPQFTINAGLLFLGAFLCAHLYSRSNDWRALWLGCLFALLSYLVRSQEFFLCLLVSMPLLPWSGIASSRKSKAALVCLALAMAVAWGIHRHAYDTDEWNAMKIKHASIPAFYDWGAGADLQRHPEILRRYGYSANDIELLVHYFVVDPAIADPQPLAAMLSELGPQYFQHFQRHSWWKLRAAIEVLIFPTILPLVLVALLLAALRPSWRVAAAWVIFLSALIAIAVWGRPAIGRIYVPLLSLLTVAPLVVRVSPIFPPQVTSGWHAPFSATILLAITAGQAWQVMMWSQGAATEDAEVRKTLTEFPTDPMVVWASAFPYASFYPVLKIPPAAMTYQFYSLADFADAPFSVAYREQQMGRGLIRRLVEADGIPIVATESNVKLLDRYCSERLHGKLYVTTHDHGSFAIHQCRCDIAAAPDQPAGQP